MEKMPEVNPEVDLYAAEDKEVKLEIDAILVKEQKESRDCNPKEKKSFVSTAGSFRKRGRQLRLVDGRRG